ncbi:lipoprotein insertase outer membrane protein LolB [Dechloromonas sp. ZY10]|uniref:lipoprotein insertase outer membrane protein LolB n=1 Tax=Dechloromonas aquae TaxID=2664436 RepID=UPI003527E549
MIRRLLAVAALLVGGCSTLPPGEMPLPPRSQLVAFSVEGRFALTSRPPDAAAQQASGRLRWLQQAPGQAEILLMTPLGQGIAEITIRPQRSHLRTDDGREYAAADSETLLREVTGHSLPLRRLADWLRARGPVVASDRHGRPLKIAENGWQISYDYADEDPDALPQRLDLQSHSGQQQIDLRLRLETWRSEP